MIGQWLNFWKNKISSSDAEKMSNNPDSLFIEGQGTLTIQTKPNDDDLLLDRFYLLPKSKEASKELVKSIQLSDHLVKLYRKYDHEDAIVNDD